MDGMIAIAGIVFTLGGPVLVIYLFLSYGHRRTVKKLDTLVRMVEQGATVDPEALSLLSEPGGAAADLRRGLIWLAIGVPLTLAVAVNEGLATAVYALIPVFIGVAYLVLVKVGTNKLDESGTAVD